MQDKYTLTLADILAEREKLAQSLNLFLEELRYE